MISFIPNTKSRPDVNIMTSGEELNLLFYGDVASIETTERYIELSINRYFFGKGMTLVNKLVYDLASEVQERMHLIFILRQNVESLVKEEKMRSQS